MSGTSFDPKPYVQSSAAAGPATDFLDVKWRLVWLRHTYPDAQLTTKHVQLDRELAVIRAIITLPNQGSATGYGSATSDETPAFVERAETRAVGRALAALGFGTEYGADFMLAPAPVATAAPTAVAPAVTTSTAPPPPAAAGPVAPTTDPAAPPVTAAPPATPPSRPRPAAASTSPGGLPAGVTIGPGGTTALPPRLAEVFAQAQPILDEPEPEAAAPVPAAPPATAAIAPEPLAPRPAEPPPPAPSGRRPAAERAAANLPPSSSVAPSSRAATPPPAGRAGLTGPNVRPPAGPRRLETESRPSRGRPEPGERGPHDSADEPADEPVFDTLRPARPLLSRVPTSAFDDDEPADEIDETDDPLADSDWTSFWRWARRRGYNNRDEIEQALNQSIRGRTPKELRTLLLNLDG